jgi:hypothetical protein
MIDGFKSNRIKGKMKSDRNVSSPVDNYANKMPSRFCDTKVFFSSVRDLADYT